MELRQLATFVMIAKTKKFNQAAELLSYAQSTITTHIQALEAELGVKLFERFGHYISLTREGKSLLSYAEQILTLEPGCSFRATIESILQECNVKPRSILEASSIESIKQFVMHDFGITMLPHFTIESEIVNKRLVLLNWQGHVSDYMVQLVHHKNKYISPTLRSFLQTAKGHFSVR